MDIKTVIALSGLVLGVVGFVIGLVQYRKAQRWKIAEFVAGEIKEAFADPAVRFALHLVDYNSSTHDLRQHTGNERLRSVYLSDITLAAALAPHTERPRGFNAVEVRIRLAFDELFGRLQRFEHFIQTNLVKTRDIHPYLRYWLDLLGQPSEHGKTPTVLHAIWAYIDFYRYTDVQRFFKRFGYDISSFSEYPAHLRGIDPPQIVVEEGVTLDCIVPIEPGAPPKNRGTALLDEVP